MQNKIILARCAADPARMQFEIVTAGKYGSSVCVEWTMTDQDGFISNHRNTRT